jgi:sarcosine oxidase, subunit beta
MLPSVTDRPLAASYDVVIIGAGIQGLSLAYELARRGLTNVAVLDRSWPGSGASGRNGELIRSIFSSAQWSGLFEHSVKRWHQLSAELDYNILFSPSGYLVLATTDADWEATHHTFAFHQEREMESELLDREGVGRLIPDMDLGSVRGGELQTNGGFAHHDAVVWAYLQAGARLGVEVHGGTRVEGVRVGNGRVTGVEVDGQVVSAGIVVNAAGGDARTINRMAGVDLSLMQTRLETLVTQALRPFLPCAIASPGILAYGHQTARGEFVGGTELPQAHRTDSIYTTYEILRNSATRWVGLFPLLAGARVIRHWAGSVTQTDDLAPMLGELPELTGYVLACAWTYGFMGAPGASDLLAQSIVDQKVPDLLAPFDPARIREGRLINEGSLVMMPEAAA